MPQLLPSPPRKAGQRNRKPRLKLRAPCRNNLKSHARARAASAEVQRAISALAQAELNLQYTKIFAPVTGVLSKRSVEPGQTVQAGQPLFSIVDLDDIWVTANFKETQLRDMKVGQRAKIKVDAYGKEFSGSVESIGGATGARFSLLPPENAT